MNRTMLALACLAAALYAAPPKRTMDRERELLALKAKLEGARGKLQTEIAARWEAKQKQVGQREVDKEELARLRETQERAYLDLSRVKEECFARERAIEDERKQLTQREDEWRFVATTVDEVMERAGESVLEAFPLDREDRRADLEGVRREYRKRGNGVDAFRRFVDYSLRWMDKGLALGVEKRTLVVEDGGARDLTVARFGHVFGYAMASDGGLYIIRQTGRLGLERYRIEPIGSQELKEVLAVKMPSWVAGDTVGGDIPTDVLQNAQSGALVSGEKVTARTRMIEFVRAGGPVMIPLLLLPVWALILALLKLWELSSRHRSGSRTSRKVFEALDKEDMGAARAYVDKHKGVVSRVIGACLAHSEWSRHDAEQAVREIIVEEAPRLNSHLNTLAVIAGVAPLLGLLGTVTGMIRLFTVITHYGTGDPRLMAAGISEALITTETGLTIAIPVLLLHNFLRNRKSRVRAEIERNTVVLLNRLWPRKGE